MIFKSLTLTNLGTYQGVQKIDLRPEAGKPVVLVGGMNGAGKTTVLDAMRLALFGAEALGARVSKAQYHEWIGQKIHVNPNLALQPTFASVTLEFEAVVSGELREFEVTRGWQRKGRTLEEQLSVRAGDELLSDQEIHEWEELVRSLVPPGVADFFLFDGEKIQNLASDDLDQGELASAIEGLLGLSIVSQLAADLDTQRARFLRENASDDHSAELSDLEAETGRLTAELEELTRKGTSAQEAVEDTKGRIAEAEAKLSVAGGDFAKNRKVWLQKEAVLQERIAVAEDQLRRLAGGALPFALATELLDGTLERLQRETTQRRAEISFSELKSFSQEWTEQLDDHRWLPASLKLSKTQLGVLLGALQENLSASLVEREPAPSEVVHGLSEVQSEAIVAAGRQARQEAAEFREVSAELTKMQSESERLATRLKKLPTEGVLEPLIQKVAEENAKLAVLLKEQGERREESATLENALGLVERKLEKVRAKVASQVKVGVAIQDIPRIQKALAAFRKQQIEEKIRELEVEVRKAFNSLCRKDDFLSRVQIGREDFGIELFDKLSRKFPKSRLSAGEKQIFAIAVLWALAKVSGRRLPVVVDTPLGRLDSEHRELLIEGYFPTASHQVILLSTDTEVDAGYFDRLKGSLSRTHLLEFDPEEGATTVRSGYFWGDKAVAAHQA